MEQKVQPPKQPRMMLMEADHLPRRDFGGTVVAAVLVRISGVRAAGIGQVKHQSISAVVSGMGGGLIHTSRAVPPFAMGLHQRAGVARVGFQVQHAVGMGIQHGVALDLLVAGQADHRAVTRRHLELALQGRVGEGNRRLRDMPGDEKVAISTP
jgi:hypothetical protein